MRVNVGRMRQTGRILLDALEGPKVQLRDTLRKIDSSSQPLPLLVVPPTPTLSPSPSPSPSNFPSSPLLPPTYTHTRTPRSRPSHIAPRGVWRSAAHFLFSPAAEQSYHSCRKTMAAASLLARTSRSVATRGAWTQLKTQHAATYAIPLLLIHRPPSDTDGNAFSAAEYPRSRPWPDTMPPNVRPTDTPHAAEYSSDPIRTAYPPHTVISMPALSPTMTAGNIGTWQKKPGDTLSPGDVLVEIETDKAQMDFEFQEEGVLAAILKDSGEKDIAVGNVSTKKNGREREKENGQAKLIARCSQLRS